MIWQLELRMNLYVAKIGTSEAPVVALDLIDGIE